MAKGPKSAHSPSSTSWGEEEEEVGVGVERAVKRAVATIEVGVGVVIMAVRENEFVEEMPCWEVEE